MSVAPALLCALVAAGAPNYSAFSEPDGYIATKEQELAAWAMLHDPEQVDAIYAEAAKGNIRAVHVIEQLEATLAESGRKLAEEATGPACLAMAVREFSKQCHPVWSFIDFLSPDRPGGVRLRSAAFRAFAVTAHKRGLENQLILSAANGLLSLALASAVLAKMDAAIGEVIPKATRLRETELETGKRLGQKLGVSLVESPHEGAEFVDSAGKTYDVMGTPAASKYWNEKRFTDAIRDHLLKSNDFTVIDLTGFTPEQIAAVEQYLSKLSAAQRAKIVRIGF